MPASTTDLSAEFAAFRAAHPDVEFIDAMFADISCVLRGKRVPLAEAEKIMRSGTVVPPGSLFLDITGNTSDPGGRGVSDGDPDAPARVVAGSLQPVPWAARPTGQMLLTILDPATGGPHPHEPRNVLAHVVEMLAADGYYPTVAVELEFYLFAPDGDGALRPPFSPLSGPLSGSRAAINQVYDLAEIEAHEALLHDIAKAAAAQAIPAGAVIAEFAPGQFEVNLQHVASAVQAADHALMFRRLVKGVARHHEVVASFLSKPYAQHSGSGMHLHVSLFDGQGQNLFSGRDGAALLGNAVAGQLATMAEAMAFFAPNPNAYRRFQPNLFVPTGRSWGRNNRSVAVRIPHADAVDARFEMRVPGADANPYLALAATLAGAHHGLREGLPPPPAACGNVGDQMDQGIPFCLSDALAVLGEAHILPRLLGVEFCNLYRQARIGELAAYNAIVPDHELAWYL